jgi:hypothetical protein
LLIWRQPTILPHFQSEEYFTVPTDSLTHNKKFLDLALYGAAILDSQRFSGSYASPPDTFKQILHQPQIICQARFDLRDESQFGLRSSRSVKLAAHEPWRKVLGIDQRSQAIIGVRAEYGDRDFRSSFM